MVVIPVEDVGCDFLSSEEMLEDDGGEVCCTFSILVGGSFAGNRVSTAWAGGRVSS